MQERQQASAKRVGEEVVEWLAAHFPEVACSLGPLPAGFRSADAFWAEASADIETCLAYQDRFAAGMDDKIRAAHLIAFYSHQFSLAAGALHLLEGRVPALTGLRFEGCRRAAGGRIVEASRFHFLFELGKAGGEASEKNAAAFFHDAFVAHMKPVIALLKRRCGLSSRAQWRLAADGLAGAFLEIGRRRGGEEGAMERALAIVKRDGSPLFSPELRYEKIETNCGMEEEALSRTYRMRGGCCLFYRSDGGSYCDTCVLLEPELQRERLRARLLASTHQ
ncbi:(2Fe-2S)-binding protein [Sinorhizobium saheli]|uniref:(2Fe-2S)-binding protein n=1 Tax=Sinorhizobium saheli TaxID=36856 RepID=UPI000B2C6081|nr:IucA/IucC family C-terminal-domain containing protein [Sinorhizobium saheli]